MAVEAQRLIAISLGKMASSRAQRGGARLHKSLLVASVLHSAQTVALLNDQQNLGLTLSLPPRNLNVALQPSMLSEITEFGDKNAGDEDCSVDAKGSLFEPKKYYELSGRNDNESDSEDELELVTLTSCVNTSPNENSVAFAPVVEQLRSSDNTFNGYVNSAVNCNEFLDSQLQSPCRKRNRNDDVEEPHAKHLRFSLSNDYSSSSCSIEPMQTDPWQVTNLVYSFSIGFSGLLRNSESSEFSLSDSAESDQPLYIHSSTSESIISCSTQIREALDTLTRPAIAMTV